MRRTTGLLLLALAFAAGAAVTAGWAARNAGARPQPAGLSVVAVPAAPADASSSGLLPDAGWPDGAPSPEQVLYSQPDLLADAAARLRPRTPGKVNLYAIAFAGDGSENVFRNEAEYLEQLLSKRFNAAGHVIVLENNPATLDRRPLATWTNLEDALDAVASKMDPAHDILLLYLTSHGSEDHTLLVDMDPLPLDQIGAGDLPGILAEHPFKYKVVIVNACYSGGFMAPLAGPNTLVVTAASADRASFGCGEQSELTWFGHAFLVDALNGTDSFRQAFHSAQAEVARWEVRDGFDASDPQISIGAGIATQLDAWRSGFAPGPRVPFVPARPAGAARAAAAATR